MKVLILFVFLLAALVATPLPARAAEFVHVLGQDIEATEIDYFLDSTAVHSFKVVNPTTLSLARNNSIVAGEEVFLNEDGSVSAIVSLAPQAINWISPKGETISLDCGGKKNAWGSDVPRMVTFFPSREYKSGCSTTKPTEFSQKTGEKISVSGDIDLNADGSLSYATKLFAGSLRVGISTLSLEPASEISFHENGAPHFFTMQAGQSLDVKQGKFGLTSFTQKKGLPVSTTLFADGTVERGILARDLKHSDFNFVIPADSGVLFSQTKKGLSLDIALLSHPTTLEAKDYTLEISKFSRDPDSGKSQVIIKTDFAFHDPEGGPTVYVPEGALVTLSVNLTIIDIKIPERPKLVERKQFLL